MRLTFCPEPRCSAPAEIVQSAMVASTDGPVEVVTTHCARRHTLVVTADALTEDLVVPPVPAG
jgi:hypothetical protein